MCLCRAVRSVPNLWPSLWELWRITIEWCPYYAPYPLKFFCLQEAFKCQATGPCIQRIFTHYSARSLLPSSCAYRPHSSRKTSTIRYQTRSCGTLFYYSWSEQEKPCKQSLSKYNTIRPNTSHCTMAFDRCGGGHDGRGKVLECELGFGVPGKEMVDRNTGTVATDCPCIFKPHTPAQCLSSPGPFIFTFRQCTSNNNNQSSEDGRSTYTKHRGWSQEGRFLFP